MKRFVIHLVIYLLVVIPTALIGYSFFALTKVGGCSYIHVPFPTIGKYYAVLLPEMLVRIQNDTSCPINYLGIAANISLPLFAFYLLFTKKVSTKTWIILLFITTLIFSIYFSYTEILI
jgi:hypothetical protein